MMHYIRVSTLGVLVAIFPLTDAKADIKSRLKIHRRNSTSDEVADDPAAWKKTLKADIDSTWTISKLSLDRLRVTDPGTLFVIKQNGITGDLADDATFSETRVENGRVFAEKGLGAIIKNKRTSRVFKVGENVYVWKTAVKDDAVWLYLVSSETLPVAERGGRTLQNRYKALVEFKFSKEWLPTAESAEIKRAITDILMPVTDAQAAATKTISLGQTMREVQSVLGTPDKIVNLGPKVTYVYKDMKVIFLDGKVADVQ